MYFVYLLESQKDGRFYIGQTNDLNERLKYHNRGKCKYTKNKGPWIIKHFKSFDTRAQDILILICVLLRHLRATSSLMIII